ASRRVARRPPSAVRTTTSRTYPGSELACRAARFPSCRVLCTSSLGRQRLLETNDQLRGVTAPVDRYHERADVVGRHDLIRFARNDRGHGDHEVLAEVAPRIAGDGVSHLAHEIAHVL